MTDTTTTNWHKKAVNSQDIEKLCSEFNLENKLKSKSLAQILSSIFLRRNITGGNDILFYLEDDLRFTHNPFLLNSIEDAIERILQAQEEGEKVLIFGDKDVDGISSTTILYDYLKKKLNMNVECRLPVGDDSYGLSLSAIDDFANAGGSLIITVDCGISNFEEIDHAIDLGLDVIVTDHHNPQEEVPNATIIIDPKLPDSTYPFHDISGAAVAYKLVSALRFASTDFYNAEICLFDIKQNSDQSFDVNCLKIKNLCKVKELNEKIIPGKTSIYDLKLPYFLQGQLIYVWDLKETSGILKELFGSGVEFNLNDLQAEICKLFPSFRGKTINELLKLSTIGKYNKEENTTVKLLFNLYVTYCKKVIAQKHPDFTDDEKKDLQLVALAALADVMPMKNENRIFVKNGIASIKNHFPRKGLAELFNKLSLKKETVTSTDLSWSVIPALNAAGRMGQSNLSLELLISEDAKEREVVAEKIYELNEERKNLVSQSMFEIKDLVSQSINDNKNLCVIYDENMNKGVTGIVAARIMQENNLPSIVVTVNQNICVGSMRSCRGFVATDFLNSFENFFINHGGHDCAAGFSFEKEKINLFLQKCKELCKTITLEEATKEVQIDAEIPPSYFTPETFALLELFEPYGSENSELLLMSSNLKLCDSMIVGKKAPQHLKLTFDTGKYKIPGMFWGQAERFNDDIKIGRNYDITFNLSRNFFNGVMSPQIIIKEMRISQ